VQRKLLRLAQRDARVKVRRYVHEALTRHNNRAGMCDGAGFEVWYAYKHWHAERGSYLHRMLELTRKARRDAAAGRRR
jgi:hypothetical protein